ncbi:cell wall surface anchor family protein [Staphylococcus aureus]|uniref:Cell wall surface anchor family protein n=1 Tax=Staphylococcus aureus TaxID=1280 RepID=A0A380EL76_STAAU|nr:cell wall surface anchor family protein [Staphylococcus aureus]
MKNDKGERQFYHYASTVEPATVIFTKTGPIIELGLKTASTWKKFEVYEGDKKLPVELVSYDSDKDYAIFVSQYLMVREKLKLCHLLNMVRTSMKTMIIR